MNLATIHRVFFIGIGGIGMSALARYFHRIGKEVTGYDKTPSPLTHRLVEEGIPVHYDDSIGQIPLAYQSTEGTLVVITPAIPKDHNQWAFFAKNQFVILKRSEVLGLITKDTYCFAVAGTHGKTTTSAILGHILHQSGVEVTAFTGGIVENYQSNLIGTGDKVSVVEADEFDRSFHRLHPDMACVTSIDADHLDIYETRDAFVSSFETFAQKVAPSNLFLPKGIPFDGTTLAIEDTADYTVTALQIKEGKYHFDVTTPHVRLQHFTWAMPGRHNVMNALTAIAMAHRYGLNEEQIRTALSTFRGIQRRFSVQFTSENKVLIDDYAHHPTEIEAVHQAVRELYPNKKILAVFQPHLFSRTRDFVEGFAESLSQFDEVALMEIYPARELPLEGVNSSWLLSKIKNNHKKLVSENELLEVVQKSDAEVILTLGAGDISNWVEPLKKQLYEKSF